MRLSFNLLQFFLVSVWTALSALLTITLITFSFRKDMSAIVARKIWSPVILFICRVKLVISGIENVNPGEKYIYISNHESLLDIPSIFSTIPSNLFFIAKKELKQVPFMGWAMLMGGMIFIDRKNKAQARIDMQRAGVLIKNGKNIISFPEGTRTKNGELGIFKRGTFLLSLNTGIEVVPIAIKGARELLPTGSIRLKPGKIQIYILPPVSPEKYSQNSVDVFASEVRQEIFDKRILM